MPVTYNFFQRFGKERAQLLLLGPQLLQKAWRHLLLKLRVNSRVLTYTSLSSSNRGNPTAATARKPVIDSVHSSDMSIGWKISEWYDDGDETPVLRPNAWFRPNARCLPERTPSMCLRMSCFGVSLIDVCGWAVRGGNWDLGGGLSSCSKVLFEKLRLLMHVCSVPASLRGDGRAIDMPEVTLRETSGWEKQVI